MRACCHCSCSSLFLSPAPKSKFYAFTRCLAQHPPPSPQRACQKQVLSKGAAPGTGPASEKRKGNFRSRGKVTCFRRWAEAQGEQPGVELT